MSHCLLIAYTHVTPVPTALWIALLVGLLFFAGLVMLFFKQTRFIAAICLALAIVPSLTLIFFLRDSVRVERAQSAQAVLEVDPQLLVDAEEHPSPELAVAALVARLQRDVNKFLYPKTDTLHQIHYPFLTPPPFAAPLRDALSKAFPFAKLNAYASTDIDKTFLPTLHPDNAGGSAVEIEIENQRLAAAEALGLGRIKPTENAMVLRIDFVPANADQPKTGAKSSVAGQLRLIAHGPNQTQLPYTVAVFSKPWAADPAAYASANPGTDPVIVFSSPAATRDDALAEARALAADQIYKRLDPELSARGAGGVDPSYAAAAHSAISAAVRDRASDQFIQKLTLRHGGAAYRAGVLVNLDGPMRKQLVASAIAHGEHTRRGTASTFFSICGLAAVILLLYFFLNSVTKGYFQFSLRAMTLLLLAVGIVVIMAAV